MNTPTKQFFQELNRELFTRGIWGKRGQRLRQELEDHLSNLTRDSLAQGLTAAEAEAKSLVQLGAPSDLADNLRQQLVRSSWLARHPVIGGLVFSFLATAGLCIGILAAGLWLMGIWVHSPGSDPHSIRYPLLPYFPSIYNQGLWALAFGVILMISLRAPLGWRHVVYVCSGIALGACALNVLVVLPLHGPGSGSITIAGHPLLAILLYPILLLAYGSKCTGQFIGPGMWGTFSEWLRLISLLSIPWVVRFWHLVRLRPEAMTKI